MPCGRRSLAEAERQPVESKIFVSCLIALAAAEKYGVDVLLDGTQTPSCSVTQGALLGVIILRETPLNWENLQRLCPSHLPSASKLRPPLSGRAAAARRSFKEVG